MNQKRIILQKLIDNNHCAGIRCGKCPFHSGRGCEVVWNKIDNVADIAIDMLADLEFEEILSEPR